MHCRYPVFLCFLLMAMAYFEGSFLKPLVSVGTGMPGYASAGEMKEIPEYAGESGREAAGKTMPEQALIKDFGIVRQMPELPTGCEITALTMMLDYYGCQADKTIMAEKYLPTVPAEFYEGEDGRIYGPDMEMNFVGDPFSSGYICGTDAILSAADVYLADQGSSLRGKDLTGAEPEDLYKCVSDGIPVLVWVTIGMRERDEVHGWYTEDGKWMSWSSNDHGAVLIGYDADTVTIADPLSGLRVYARKMFEGVFASRGSRCIILIRV